MPFTVGESVGAYRILEQLGQGGMATVYKAYHAALDRYVALKVLHPAFLEDPNFLARFQREARLVAKLDHANIVPVYDFAEHGGQPFLVMKFVTGETLKARLARGPLSSDEMMRILEVIGKALAYAHKHGVLHRDVKPSNVLLADDGGIYLADFGLARIAQSGDSTLTSDMILGTPQYISPEQAMGKKELDHGTDIYSFGVMLYEMTVGQVPFSADTPFSIIHDHIYTPLPLPRQMNANVPEEVERVLLKALAKDRDDRYVDVNAFIGAFRNAWGGSGIPAQPDTIVAALETAPRSKSGLEATIVNPEESDHVPNPPKLKKKRSPWWYVAGGLLTAFCCLLALSALDGNQNGDTDTADPAATQSAQNPRSQIENLPAVKSARQAVDDSPNDPDARFDLALAYLDAGFPRPALEQLQTAADLAGREVEFFLMAGEELRNREQWVGAAGMLLKAMTNMPRDEISPELAMLMHEAVYRASSSPEFTNLISLDAIGKLDEPMMLVADARFSFLHESHEQGWQILESLVRQQPGYYEARLLEGEFYTIEGAHAQARRVLGGLLDEPALPVWIMLEAERILKQLP